MLGASLRRQFRFGAAPICALQQLEMLNIGNLQHKGMVDIISDEPWPRSEIRSAECCAGKFAQSSTDLYATQLVIRPLVHQFRLWRCEVVHGSCSNND